MGGYGMMALSLKKVRNAENRGRGVMVRVRSVNDIKEEYSVLLY